MTYFDPDVMALYASMMGGTPPTELPEGPACDTNVVPLNHCPLHPEVLLMSSVVKVKVTKFGGWTAEASGPKDWCSQCDLEIEWARQRPHLELV